MSLDDDAVQAISGVDVVTLRGAPALVMERSRAAHHPSRWPRPERLAWALIGLALLSIAVLRFLRLALPMAMPGIISGTAIVFSLAAAMYVIPTLLIGDRFQTLATLTARAFLLMRNEQLGSTTATVLLVLAVTIVLASSWAVKARGDSR